MELHCNTLLYGLPLAFMVLNLIYQFPIEDSECWSTLVVTYFEQMNMQSLSVPQISHMFSLYSFTDSSQRAYGCLFDANKR